MNDPLTQACEWLARLDAAGCSERDRAQFEEWRGADPRHAQAFARAQQAWSRLDGLRATAPRPAAATGAPAAAAEDRRASSGGAWPDRGWRALAATAILATILGGLLWLRPPPPGDNTLHYSTAVGGRQRAVLADGSVLELNTATEVRVDLGPRLRRVYLLKGECDFSVAHDRTRPFVVVAGDTAVRAVGTHFDVRRGVSEDMQLVVSEGRVAVGRAAQLTVPDAVLPGTVPVLHAGQAASVDAGGLTVREIAGAERERQMAWREGMLALDGETLQAAAAEFNRYNRRRIIITDPQLGALRIGGYFRVTGTDAFVAALTRHFGLRAVADGENIRLLPAETPAPD